MNLFERTNHESGIVVYPEGGVIVTNWGSYGEDQMPVLSPFGEPMPWPEESGYLDNVGEEKVDDIRTVLPGRVWLTDEVDADGNHFADTDMDIISDENGDIIRLFLDTSPKSVFTRISFISAMTVFFLPTGLPTL